MSVQPILNYTMYGKQVKVFPFRPNWKSPVVETLEWKTDVLRSFSGTEQRRKVRQVPRRSFEYSMLVSGEMSSMLESYLWNWQHRHFALPVWTDVGKLTTGVIAGQTTMMVNTVNLSFQAGDYCILISNPKTFEVLQISSVLADRIISTSGAAFSWSSGTKVYPLVVAHLATSLQTTRHSSVVTSIAQVVFTCAPENTDPWLPTGVAPVMYDGYEVVTHRQNWKSVVTSDFSRLFDTVDSGVGAVGYFDRESVSRIVKQLSWTLKTRNDIVEFRKFISRMSGQLKTCWLPSWNDDFKLSSGNAGDQIHLNVKGIWFNGLGGVDINRDRLSIALPNGQTVYKKIVGMFPNYSADTTQLQLDSVLGTTVSVNDNITLRLLMKNRFATDKIVIPWQTDGVATPSTSFITVKT